MMRLLPLALPLVLLAGCASEEPPAQNNSAAANEIEMERAGPWLGDIDLSEAIRASDAALTWALEIAPGQITYTGFAGVGSKVSDLYPVDPKVEGSRATYTTQTTKGIPVVIVLTRERCVEGGKPIVVRPLTVEIRVEGKVLKGCAYTRIAELGTDPGNVSAVVK